MRVSVWPPAVTTSPLPFLPPCSSSRRNLSFSASSTPNCSTHHKFEKYHTNPIKYWNNFYKLHQNKFFKDRHYLEKEWGRYFSFHNDDKCIDATKGKVALEAHEDFSSDQVNAFVCDVTVEDISEKILPSSIDVVTLIFMLSAVSPKKMHLILQNIKKVLKPNGYVLLRDYAIGDFSQCAFYFSEDFLSTMFEMDGFNTVEISVYSKQIENRLRKIVMDRRWIKGVFYSSPCFS
ncbi:uncharacterized protein LOC143887671 isoform X2 [Tasmannia lanceolata]|uniref:uncharacterized protein LOC143887671 isoform X2 n=1 Tax=Tasmannia lanceolata TaxID=3420 RepID=UPI0040641D88